MYYLNTFIAQSHRIAAVFTLHDGPVTGEFTLHDFTIEIITDNSVCSANYSQTHMRSDEEIIQDHADIMVCNPPRTHNN